MFIFKSIFFFRVIILLVLASFIGCVTSRIEYVESSMFPENKIYRISEVFMKDGTVKVLRDKEPVFKLKYKGNENVIVYYEDVNIEKTIQLSDVSSLKLEVLESNKVLSVIIIVSSVVVFFLLLFWLLNPFKGMKIG